MAWVLLRRELPKLPALRSRTKSDQLSLPRSAAHNPPTARAGLHNLLEVGGSRICSGCFFPDFDLGPGPLRGGSSHITSFSLGNNSAAYNLESWRHPSRSRQNHFASMASKNPSRLRQPHLLPTWAGVKVLFASLSALVTCIVEMARFGMRDGLS